MESTKKIVQVNTDNGPQQFEATVHKPEPGHEGDMERILDEKKQDTRHGSDMYWALRLADGMSADSLKMARMLGDSRKDGGGPKE